MKSQRFWHNLYGSYLLLRLLFRIRPLTQICVRFLLLQFGKQEFVHPLLSTDLTHYLHRHHSTIPPFHHSTIPSFRIPSTSVRCFHLDDFGFICNFTFGQHFIFAPRFCQQLRPHSAKFENHRSSLYWQDIPAGRRL